MTSLNNATLPSSNGIENISNIEVRVGDNDSKINDEKNKLWMDFDDFFVCFK